MRSVLNPFLSTGWEMGLTGTPDLLRTIRASKSQDHKREPKIDWGEGVNLPSALSSLYHQIYVLFDSSKSAASLMPPIPARTIGCWRVRLGALAFPFVHGEEVERMLDADVSLDFGFDGF